MGTIYYLTRSGNTSALNANKVWLATLHRWADLDLIGWYTATNDLVAAPMGSGEKNLWRYLQYGYSGDWREVSKSAFKEAGGLLPTELKDVKYEPLPGYALGKVLDGTTIWRWQGGKTTPGRKLGYTDVIDREGRLWTWANDHMRYQRTPDGKEWESAFWKIEWKDGMPVPGNTTWAEEGLVNSTWVDPMTGERVKIRRDKKAAFIYNYPLKKWMYKHIPTEVWDAAAEFDFKAPFYTIDQLIVALSPLKVLMCKGKCQRWMRYNDPNAPHLGCYHHAICKECMPVEGSHVHCPRCGRQTDNNQPAIPSDENTSGVYRSCTACKMCFRCTRECLFCEPNKNGDFRCRNCCKGEHYEDDATSIEAKQYIREYTDQHYPPARPPFPDRKCPKCKGSGLVVTLNGKDYCQVCKGSGEGRDKDVPMGLWMGVELEVEVPKGLLGAVMQFRERDKDIILKKDSTIRNGFEVVTGPFSLEEHTKMWPSLAKELVRNGCRSWKYTNTGLHVHCNWEFLSQMELCKYNVWLNDPGVKPDVVKVAGRESIYAALKPKKMDDGKNAQTLPHREALNITTHRNKTFELRIFKGTLAEEHILADLQFVHASVHWIKEADVADLDKWSPFWAYVLAHKSLYPELIDHYNRQVTIEKSKEDAA